MCPDLRNFYLKLETSGMVFGGTLEPAHLPAVMKADSATEPQQRDFM